MEHLTLKAPGKEVESNHLTRFRENQVRSALEKILTTRIAEKIEHIRIQNGSEVILSLTEKGIYDGVRANLKQLITELRSDQSWVSKVGVKLLK